MDKIRLAIGGGLAVLLIGSATGAINLRNSRMEIDRLHQNVKTEQQQKTKAEQKTKSKQTEVRNLNDVKTQLEQDNRVKQDQINDLQQQLEAKLQRQNVTLASAIVSKSPEPVAAAVPVSANAAKAFIYEHESGNNPGSINPTSGACGLGQAWPCSKMPCSLSDYACQDSFFTQYMQARYGTWEAAQSFWLANRHW